LFAHNDTDRKAGVSSYYRQKGSSFERLVADYLKANGFPFADRRVKSGAKDKGDIGGVYILGQPIVLECKNTSKISLGTWAAEAESERVNDEALAGVVIHKRHGKGKAEDQWVTLTLRDLTAILTGKRP
jgi:Holliday junction resolvase